MKRASKGPYDVFISYSHCDKPIVRRLAARLRRYRPFGPWWKLPWPPRMEVFRDDDEIAGQILSKELEEALAASSTLVVACSPDARASRYVSEEITTFKKLHPNGNIVPVLVRGLPNDVARQRGMDAQAAFPDILETVLAPDTLAPTFSRWWPFSAEYRKHWHHLLAAIYQVPRKVIENRERKRRRRMVVGLGLSAVVILGVMTLYENFQFNSTLATGLDRIKPDTAPNLVILLSAFALENATGNAVKERARELLEANVRAFPLEDIQQLRPGIVQVAWTGPSELVVSSDTSIYVFNELGNQPPPEPTSAPQNVRLETHSATTYDPRRPTRSGELRPRRFVAMSSFREVSVFEMPSRKAETLSRGEQYYSDKVKWCITDDEPRLFANLQASGADGLGAGPWRLYSWNIGRTPRTPIAISGISGFEVDDSAQFDIHPRCHEVAVANYRYIAIKSLDGREIARYDRRMNIRCVRWNPNGYDLAACDDDKVTLWGGFYARDKLSESPSRAHAQTVIDVAWSPDGRLLASVSSDGNLQAGSPSDVKPELNIYTGRRLSAVAWNSDGSRIATGSDDGQVHIWGFGRREAATLDIGGRRTRIGSEGTEIPDSTLISAARRHAVRPELADSECRQYFALPECRCPRLVRMTNSVRSRQ